MLVVIGSGIARAQADPSAADARPFAPVQGGAIDSVSSANGSLQVHIPLWSLKQRGNLNLSFALRYISSGYQKDHECLLPNKPCTDRYDFYGSGMVVAASTEVSVTAINEITEDNAGDSLNPTFYSNGYYWQVTTPDGGTHKLASIGGHNFRAEDGSGWLFNESTYVLTSRDGVHYVFAGTPPNGQGVAGKFPYIGRLLHVEDPNGNQINLTYTSYVSGGVTFYTQTGWVDTLGRTISYDLGTSTSDYSGCTGPGTTVAAREWTPPGSSTPIKYCYAMTQLNTNFFHGASLSQPGSNQTEFENTSSERFLQSVVLLDGSSWQFQYTPIDGSQYNYGELARITLPTGGTLNYTWAEAYQICSSSATQNSYSSFVTSRVANANDAIGAQTWHYTGPYSGSSAPTAPVTVSTTDPLGNQIVHTLTGVSGTCSLFETQTDYFDNKSNKLRTDTISYYSQPDFNRLATNYTHESQMAMAVFPHVKTTTMWAGSTAGDVKSTTYTYDPGFTATSLDGSSTSVISYGQVTGVVETDYGAPSPGSPLRSTTTTYLSSQNGTALANNLLVQPASVTITDGPTGAQESTTYGYDENGLSAGNASSGTGWNPSPLSGTVRGNQTSIKRYWDTNSTSLVTSKAYTNTGMLASLTEPANPGISPAAVTTYSYSGTYDGAYLTTLTNALGQGTNYGYDANTGLTTSVTDANGVQVGYGYDAAERLQSVARPAGSHNQASNITYNYPDANTVARSEQMTSSTSETLTTRYDGLGRERQVDHGDSEGDVYVDTTYDGLGRKASVSTPYRSQSDATSYGLTLYSYDALGRLLQVTNPADQSTATNQYSGTTTLATSESNNTVQSQRMSKVDGLERLTKICEVSSTAPSVGPDSPASCGLEFSGNGYLTSYTQSTRGMTGVVQGGQTRSFSYDSLRQLTDSTNPESGHIHFVYDPDGNLFTKTMPLANADQESGVTTTVTYQHDALHRLTGKTYSRSDGGPIATPSANLSYDQATVDGKNLENGIGRLTSSYSVLSGSMQAKSVYSYDNAGNVESHYQCVLSNCTRVYQDVEYYHDGADNLTSQTTPQNSFTYAFNDAGHITAVTPSWISDANHPATILSSAVYAPNGGWSAAHFGNLTNESYTYSPRWLVSEQVNGYNPANLPKAEMAIRIDGSEQSVQAPNQPASPGSGSTTITGNELKKVVATCSTNVAGQVAAQVASPKLVPPKCFTNTYYDSGTVTITVNGHADSAAYGQGSTGAALAASLASAINSDAGAFVNATASGAGLSFTARSLGAGTNYYGSFTVTHTSSSNFPNASYNFSPGYSVFTGGQDATTTTIYDTGSLTLTVGNVSQSVSYGQGSTWQGVSQSLINAANANPNFPATLGFIDGQTMYVQARVGGSGGNVPASFTATWDTTHFGNRSFFPVWSANALSGGQDQTGNEVAIYNYTLTHAPNTQITAASDSINGNWSYSYDEFNRLHTATQKDSNSNVLSSLSWDYDRYGNRWHQNNTGGTGLTHILTVNPATNQAPATLGYDAAGNVTNDTNHAFTYDQENRIAQVNGGLSYIYDAEGRRVGKSDGTVYVISPDGRIIDELNGATWKRTEIYAGNHHVATDTPSGVYFTHADWIGTERARTNPMGELCEYFTSEPFGDNLQAGTPSGISGCNPSPDFLTGKQRDPETGLDDFGARYLSSQWGRWMSADWSAMPEAFPTPRSPIRNRSISTRTLATIRSQAWTRMGTSPSASAASSITETGGQNTRTLKTSGGLHRLRRQHRAPYKG